MSCKYCDEYAEIAATIADEHIAKYQAYIEHCVSLDGKPSARLVFTDGCDDWERTISFCPMCGEKLRAGEKQ